MSQAPVPPHFTLRIAPDHPAFAGHFPGRALLPGVALLAEVLELARTRSELRDRLGDTVRIGTVKFLAPVLPGASLSVALRSGPREIRFEVREGELLCASGHLEVAA